MIYEIPVPTKCPRCNDPLVNEFYEDKTNGNFLLKRCTKRTDHWFQCQVADRAEFLTSATISLSMNPLVRVAWNFKKGYVEVAKGTLEELIQSGQEPARLPFFIPDFSNIKGLVKKVKLYVTFS